MFPATQNFLKEHRDRCTNPKNKRYYRYGGRGIKILMTYGQLLDIWIRDKGWKLERPSVDRIDNDGPYSVNNVRFIERLENSRKGNRKIAIQ